MILITGATGFVGGRMLEYFSAIYGKNQVLGLGRNLEVITKRKNEGYLIETCDLTKIEEITAFFNFHSIKTVVHVAAKSSPWGTYDEFYKDNVLATENVLQNLTKHPSIKFIYISTPSIYFNFTHRFQVKESDPIDYSFVNAYTKTKFEAENKVVEFAQSNNRFAVVFRPRAILGRGDTVIIPRVLKAFNEGKLRVIGDKKTQADFTSVENLCTAVNLAMKTELDLTGEIFNVTDDQPENLWEFVEFMLEKMDLNKELKKVPYQLAFQVAAMQERYHRLFKPSIEPTLTRYGIGILNYSLTMDISKLKNILGYQPVISSRESVIEYIESIQKKS
jgi:nucleoside-diphosphate-sugar epimerase